jgi:cytochrome c-type biogenesis protein CcmH/NrfG
MEEAQCSDARQALNAALYCQRGHPFAAFMLGNLEAQQSRWPRARRFWDEALRTLSHLKDDSPVSDISGVTAGQLRRMIRNQLHQTPPDHAGSAI